MLFLLLKHCAKCDSDSRNVGIVFIFFGTYQNTLSVKMNSLLIRRKK